METRVFLGKKTDQIDPGRRTAASALICSPQLELAVPVMFSAMSYGSISYNAHESLAQSRARRWAPATTPARAAYTRISTNTVPTPSSRWLPAGSASTRTTWRPARPLRSRWARAPSPASAATCPGAKIVGDVSKTRMIPEGSDAISPAPHHDIYSIEDLRQLVYSLKEATEYKKPVIVKVAAVHNVAAIASGIARSGADIIAIDGFRGGTGAAPTRIRDNVGIPIELALASVDQRLREEGIRDNVSIVVGGSIRSSADVVKAIALGADAVYIATARSAGPGLPPVPDLPGGQVQLGHRHPASGAGQAAEP